MTKIIVYISGGLLSAVYSTDPEVEVILYDEDNVEAGDPPPFLKKDLDKLVMEATANCATEIKTGKFYEVF